MKEKKKTVKKILKTYYVSYRVIGTSAVRTNKFPTEKKRTDFLNYLRDDSCQYEIIKQWDV